MKTVLYRHLQVLLDTLGRMAKTPFSTLVSILVLGIAIAFPLILLKISDSTELISGQWQGKPKLTVFLQPLMAEAEDANADEIDRQSIDFGHQLLQIPTIRDIEYISPVEALEEFRQSSGLGDLLSGLPGNPLPPILVVHPEEDIGNSGIKLLAAQLLEMDQVDTVSYDHLWLERLAAMTALLKRSVLVLSALMAIGVVLIISNTVRTGIQDRSDEIEIVDQIGGTASFVRRPFLYYGVLQGAAGALLAMAFANSALFFLGRPVEQLASLYDSSFRIEWIDFQLFWLVLLVASLLGWISARFTVGNYIRRLRANVRGK
jgi:cell division transport system permease protein